MSHGIDNLWPGYRFNSWQCQTGLKMTRVLCLLKKCEPKPPVREVRAGVRQRPLLVNGRSPEPPPFRRNHCLGQRSSKLPCLQTHLGWIHHRYRVSMTCCFGMITDHDDGLALGYLGKMCSSWQTVRSRRALHRKISTSAPGRILQGSNDFVGT